jgi:hypothetical protein
MSGRAHHLPRLPPHGRKALILLAFFTAQAAHAGRLPAARKPVLRIERDRVGAVRKDTKLEVPILKKLFRGCRFTSTTKILEKRPVERVIKVLCGGRHILTLRSQNDLKTLASVEVLTSGAKSPAGVGIGDTFGDLYKLGKVDCDAGIDPATRRIQCMVLGESAFAYAGQDNTDGTAGLLPSEDKLKPIKITGVVWRAGLI